MFSTKLVYDPKYSVQDFINANTDYFVEKYQAINNMSSDEVEAMDDFNESSDFVDRCKISARDYMEWLYSDYLDSF